MHKRPRTLLCLQWCGLASMVASATSSVYRCGSQPGSPVQIPIRNVTLSNQILRRGAVLSIGTPQQDLAFVASEHVNNTFIYDALSPCGSDVTPLACAGSYGGFFDEARSTTWSQAASMSALSSAQEMDTKAGQDDWGVDTLILNSTLSFQKFPLALTRVDGLMMNAIGLGQNSTLLNYLVSAGAIASRTWSMWQGWTGADSQHQIDGTLVLGGYDAAKAFGANITQPLVPDPNCPSGLVVTVTNVVMNLANGSNPSIVHPSAGFALRACITPDYPVMTLSQDIWDNFTTIANTTDAGRSLGYNLWGMLVLANSAYTGDLTLSLSGGLDITVPNHQLVVPDYSISSTGQTMIKNGTTREILINSLQDVNKNDMPLFGQSFLTSAHLLVDYDRQQFTLWRSDPTQSQKLTAIAPPSCIDSSTTPSSSNSASSTTPAAASTTAQAPPNTAPANAGAAISNGAIAGVVIGVVAALSFIIGVILALLRRRRARRHEAANRDEASKRAEARHSSNPMFIKPEMASDRHPPQEMPLVQHPPYQLAPYEMPDNPDSR